MKKSEREIVFNKYGGKCAYCGCDLHKGWHVDHLEPVSRKWKTIHHHWKHIDTGEILDQNGGLKKLNHMDNEERRKWKYVERRDVPDGFEYPERDVLENKIPSCASCNINKHGDSVEGFRESIAGYLRSLNLRMVQYKMVKKYGLVEETNKPVVFYFERLEKQ